MASSGLTPKQIDRAWQDIGKYSQDIHSRSEDPAGWEILPGSALARDNKATSPLQVSHLVQSLLTCSSNHLHALCTLLFEAGALHTYASGTVVRGAIESAGAAAWVLQPSSPKERRIRALRLRVLDHRDRANAMRTWNVTEASEVERQAFLDSSAALLGLAKAAPPRTTDVLKEVSKHVNTHGRLSPFAMWQLASGLAHGRQWPALAFLDREERVSADPDTVNVRFTMSLERLLPMAWVAMHTLEHAVSLYETRGAKPVPPAVRAKSRAASPRQSVR